MGKNCRQNQILRPEPKPTADEKNLLSVVFLTLLISLALVLNVNAQEPPALPAPTGGSSQSNSGFGINGIVSHTPQEEALSDTGGNEDIDKFDIYFDWEWMRIGINITNAALDFTVYNNNWEAHLKKNTTYLAYRLSSAEGQSDLDLFILAGLAYTEASLSITNVNNQSSSDFGYMAGGGVLYPLGDLSLGLALLTISTESDFDGIKIATGSTQLLSGFKLSF
jgi:hypothetical protein